MLVRLTDSGLFRGCLSLGDARTEYDPGTAQSETPGPLKIAFETFARRGPYIALKSSLRTDRKMHRR